MSTVFLSIMMQQTTPNVEIASKSNVNKKHRRTIKTRKFPLRFSFRNRFFTKMKLQHDLILHKCTYFDSYLYLVWTLCNGFFLYSKLDYLKVPKLLLVTAYILMITTFALKFCISQHRQFTSDMSKLSRFLLITILIETPLVSFCLISVYMQLSTPVEVCLHCFLLLSTLIESVVSFLVIYESVKKAANQRPPSLYSPPIELQTLSRTFESSSRQSRSVYEEHTNLQASSSRHVKT